MGLLRLTVGDWARLPDERLARVFIAGPDELPYPGRAFRSGDQLVIERRDDTSGCVWAPWPAGPKTLSPAAAPNLGGPDEVTPPGAEAAGATRGEWLSGTATLMEREEPYLLEVELARGAVYRLRNQLATWRQLGLESTATLDGQVAEATRLFSRAATRQAEPDACLPLAEQALAAAADASLLLVSLYAKQAMAVRQAATPQLPTLLGFTARGPLGPAGEGPLPGAFNAVALPCAWSEIEASEGKRRWARADEQFAWAQQAGLRVCAGPLIEFHDRAIPDWAYLWEGDFDSLLSIVTSHVEAVVNRYRGRVQLWNVGGRINRRRVLGLSDEQRLQLVAGAVRAVREADPKAPVVLSIDQPWGEYLLEEPSDLAPIDFADALERADLGIAGFGLELNVGYTPDGSSARNPLDFSRLLDHWSMRLELPLLLSITTPSASGPDALASPKLSVPGGGVDPRAQADWATRCLPMLLAKNCVQVVVWNAHRDDHAHYYPHSGLLDAGGDPKPVLEELRRVREAHLV
ncbi:MAG: endo-1,4-beta-xylanase [Planctomycetota bacterium]